MVVMLREGTLYGSAPEQRGVVLGAGEILDIFENFL